MTSFPDVQLLSREVQGCFCLNYNNSRGSAFLHWENDLYVFVTAAHVMRKASLGDNVLLLRDNGWSPHKLTKLYFHPHDDVCIFDIEGFGVGGEPPPPYPTAFIGLGWPTVFLGFPHGLHGNYPGQGWPTPLVRCAFFSGIIEVKGRKLIVLDGFNNPGYSGAPVYCANQDGSTARFGVVAGYRYEQEAHSRLYRKDEHGVEQLVPDIYAKPNSGMINVTPWNSVGELMAAAVSA